MNNTLMLQNLTDFDIQQILESGQAFRFHKISDSSYLLLAKQKLIRLTQQKQSTTCLIHHATTSELNEIWGRYFDLDTDYSAIKEQLAQKDEYMYAAIKFGQGIRLLKQEPWETLISFIVSQNKAIPHIKECIEQLSIKFGTCLGVYDNDYPYYTFPTPWQLAEATEEELRACKVGFRAPYIMDATRKVLDGIVDLEELYFLPSQLAREKLLLIKGVGPKIADCILLFAYGKMDVFPTDVWIKRVIEGMYFNGETVPLQKIQEFAMNYYGNLAGYAQQYLFFYGRELALYKEKNKNKRKITKIKENK